MLHRRFSGRAHQEATQAAFGSSVRMELTDAQAKQVRDVQLIIERAKQLGARVDLEVALALGISGSRSMLDELEDRAEQIGGVLEFAHYVRDGGTVRFRFSR